MPVKRARSVAVAVAVARESIDISGRVFSFVHFRSFFFQPQRPGPKQGSRSQYLTRYSVLAKKKHTETRECGITCPIMIEGHHLFNDLDPKSVHVQ